MTLEAFSKILTELGATNIALVLTVVGAMFFLLQQIVKLRKEVYALKKDQDVHLAEIRNNQRSEIVEAITMFEKLKDSNLSDEEQEILKASLLETVPGYTTTIEKTETKNEGKSIIHTETNSDGYNKKLWELDKKEKFPGTLGRLFEGSFFLVWGTGWGIGGSTFGFGGIVLAFKASMNAFAISNTLSGVGFFLLTIFAVIVWGGLILIPALGAILSATLRYLEIVATVTNSMTIQKWVFWLEGQKQRISSDKLPT